jgi:WD40 repeat protein
MPRLDQYGDALPPGVVARLGTTRLRPAGSIEHLTFSPDGKRLAAWLEEMYVTKALTIWDATDGRELRRVDLPGASVAHLQWLANGRGIAVLEGGGDPYLWEFTDQTTKPLPSVFGRGAPGLVGIGGAAGQQGYTCFAVSPDGKHLVGARSGGPSRKEHSIDIWRLKTGKNLGDLAKPQLFAKPGDACSALFYTPDGHRLITVSPLRAKGGSAKDSSIIVWDAATGTEQRRFKNSAPKEQGTRMSVAISNQLMALGMEDEPGTVAIWNLATGQSRSLTTKHSLQPNRGFGISAVTFSADGRTLVTAGRGGEIKCWDPNTLQPTREIPNASQSWIEALAVSPDGKTLASGGQDQLIRLWDVKTGEERGPHNGLLGRVTGVRMSADSKAALTLSADGWLRIWDAATGRQTRSIAMARDGRSWPRGELTPDGHTLLTSEGNRLRAFDMRTGESKELPNLPPDIPCDWMRCGADGKSLVALSGDKVTLLDWPVPKVRRTVTLLPPERKPGTAHADAADISPDGRWLITLAHCAWYREDRGMRFGYGADSVLDLWNAGTGQHVRRVLAGKGVCRSVMYTADGSVILVGGGGTLKRIGGESTQVRGNLNLLEPLTGRVKHGFASASLRRGPGILFTFATALSADGRLLFTGSSGGDVIAYEILTGQVRYVLDSYRGIIMDIAGSKDGRRLIAGGGGLNALVWNVSLADPALAGKPPSPAELTLLWDQLLDLKSEASLCAMRRLAAHPETTIGFLRTVLKRVETGPDDALLDRLVRELGDAKFATRQQAYRRLEELGEAAVVGLKARLGNTKDPEVQARLMRLVAQHDPVTPTATMVREARALEILEQLDTVAARSLLRELASGAPNARRTQAAAAGLSRIER